MPPKPAHLLALGQDKKPKRIPPAPSRPLPAPPPPPKPKPSLTSPSLAAQPQKEAQKVGLLIERFENSRYFTSSFLSLDFLFFFSMTYLLTQHPLAWVCHKGDSVTFLLRVLVLDQFASLFCTCKNKFMRSEYRFEWVRMWKRSVSYSVGGWRVHVQIGLSQTKYEAAFGRPVTGFLCCQGSHPGAAPAVPASLVSEDGCCIWRQLLQPGGRCQGG